MNKAKLKTYAPVARREFIQAMTDRAGYYGLTATTTEPVAEKGEVAVIGGRSFPIGVAKKRKVLEDRIKRHGFEQTMEAVAYTWFNRLVAIRFMELHGYLDHGYRVLSHPDGKPTPEILEHAEHVELPGLKKEAVIDLKLAGNKEGELYRLLLTAQCNALHTAMPFLFEKIDDETELLLPDNLLNSDSLMRKLVGEIEEEDWNEVEIIGWLYQFYISEKKDEVIGKVVASEDMPAATQLFTPNWIVKYLVQNTLGRLWMEHHPESPLKSTMEYYIEPAEQTSEVQSQLQQIIRQRAQEHRWPRTDTESHGKEEETGNNRDELSSSVSLPCHSVADSDHATDEHGRNTERKAAHNLSSSVADVSLNPELLTLLDPACGSGHILVEAYDLFKAIYQERGYRAKDIPALILQKNLYGMEIDDRAAQLAAFALMMKARADDRRIFVSEAKPNILAFEDSQGMNANEIAYALNAPINKNDIPNEFLFEEIQEEKDGLFSKKALAEKGHVSQGDISALLELFENAKTFGSLIQVSPKLAAKLPEIEKRIDDVLTHGDLTHASAHVLKPLLQQSRLLARQYDVVAANPPYLSQKGMVLALKEFGKTNFPKGRSDLYAMFIERTCRAAKENGYVSLMTPFTWMFIDSFGSLREWMITNKSLLALVQPEYHAFFESAYVPICAFVVFNRPVSEAKCVFVSLQEFYGENLQAPKLREAIIDTSCKWRYEAAPKEFKSIDSCPIAYWVSKSVLNAFQSFPAVSQIAVTKKGMATGNNKRFVRMWQEVAIESVNFCSTSRGKAIESGKKWFPYNDGGAFKRWYGNNESIVNWYNDGEEAKVHATERNNGGHWSRLLVNLDYFFRPGVTWTAISTGNFAARKYGDGFLFSSAGMCLFSNDTVDENIILAVLNSVVGKHLLKILSPTLNYGAGEIGRCPIARTLNVQAILSNVNLLVQLAKDGWDSFETSWDFQTLPVFQHKAVSLKESQEAADNDCHTRFSKMKELEVVNNSIIIEAYGLKDELSPDVPDSQITLYRPDPEEDIKRLLSYAIGCIMGRYSLDKPGLIYAHSGNQNFDASPYETFRADDDGIIPLVGTDWGIRDDAANRFVEFIRVAWPKEHLEENLKFVADSLGSNTGEQPRDTIRRYLATGFYKHHLSMYKKRPIYWLFSSGKQRAFQCLVYLHRYHEGTLARMRTEYVIPLQGQIAARIEQLEGDKSKATSTSHRKKLQKEQDDLKKQQTELLTFEEKLKHAADQKITLDLDDGVKVNYAKFGELLAESKAITGGKEEE